MSNHLSIGTVRKTLKTKLSTASIEAPGLEASLIVEHVTGLDRSAQIVAENEPLEPSQIKQIESIFERRKKGEPLDHIFGEKEFYGHDFKINKYVLSPRPETEMIVDYVLSNSKPDHSAVILDMGTGSGAILLSILLERAKFIGLGTDISEPALAIAEENAKRHELVSRARFKSGNWLEPAQDLHFDFIVSNPPYITKKAMLGLSREVSQFDPDIALCGGNDGLDAYREIARNAREKMNHGAHLVLEIGYDQGEAVPYLLERHGYSDIKLHQDLSGHDRMVSAIATK